MKTFFVGLTVALLLLPIESWSAASQSREEGVSAIKSRLLEVPSAPYKLEASYNGRGFQFCNTEGVLVQRFRFGCAELKDGIYKVRSERSWFEGSIAPTEGAKTSCRFWDSNHGFFPVEICKKGKLAVVSVELANGVKWKLGE
jgi:hypothetical protein